MNAKKRLAAVRRYWPYLVFAAVIFAERDFLWPSVHLGDYFVFWYAGRLAATGRSPYDPAAWVEAAQSHEPDGIAVNVVPRLLGLLGPDVSVWVYPPWTAYLLAPFGALPIELGLNALQLSLLVVGSASAIALARSLPWRSSTSFALALGLAAAFQPFALSIRTGHLDPILLLGIALVGGSLRGGRPVRFTVGSLLLAMKPHVTALFGVAVAGVLLWRRAWRPIVLAGAALLLLAAAPFARHPEALSSLTAGAGRSLGLAGGFASTWALGQTLSSDAWLPIGAALVAGVCVACYLGVRLSPPEMRAPMFVAAALTASIAVLPYLATYDYLLLLPAAYVALLAADFAAPRLRVPHRFVVLAAAGFFPWAAYYLAFFSGQQWINAVIPLLFALLVLASGLLTRGRGGRRSDRE